LPNTSSVQGEAGSGRPWLLEAVLPVSDRENDVEILALRHQIAVLERQPNGQQVRFHAIEHANRRIRSPPCG
jgi:hypothetical protein